MKIKFQIRDDEVFKIYEAMFTVHPWGKLISKLMFGYLQFVAVAFSLIFVMLVKGDDPTIKIAAVYVAINLIFGLTGAQKRILKWIARGMWQTWKQSIGTDFGGELDTDSLSDLVFNTSGGTIKMPWKLLSPAVDSNDFIFLSYRPWIAVPKTAFPDKQAYDSFIMLVESRKKALKVMPPPLP